MVVRITPWDLLAKLQCVLIWPIEQHPQRCVHMASDGTRTEHALPRSASFTGGLAEGRDVNIGVRELGSRQLGELVLKNGGAGAASVAAVDALFAGGGSHVVEGVVSSQPSAV